MADKLDGEIEAVEAKIAKVEGEIDDVTEQLKLIVAQLADHELRVEQRPDLLAREKRLGTEKEQLRKEKEDLRKKEAQIREEKLLLLKSSPGSDRAMASPELAAFWKALPRAQLTHDGRVLELADGTTFLGSAEWRGQLYVRSHYEQLWAMVRDLLSSGTRRLLITGNPGIGKSCFGLYMLHELALLGKTVVWQRSRGGERYLFKDDAVFQGDINSFKEELRDSSIWLLIDEPTSNIFIDFKAITIMFSSPKRDNYKNFLKLHCSTARYMPVWSYAEIEQCRNLLFEVTVTAAKSRELFVRWGGVPRYVLEKAHDSYTQQSLDDALSLADFSTLIAAAGSLDLADTNSHRLMHIIVNDSYEREYTTFASEFIADQVISGASTERLGKMTAFLAGSQNFGVLGALRGHLFEAFAHNAILCGGDFEVRSMGNSAAGRSTVTFSRSTKKWFSALGELKDFGELDYCRPISKNFGVVDAIRMPCSLLQMTVSATHGINEQLLGNLLNSLAEASEYVLYFVVPDAVFDRFNVNFKASVPPVSGRFDRLVIKALKIPLSGELRPGRGKRQRHK